MPLIKSGTKEAISSNIRSELRSGRPKDQSVAIALDTARRAGANIPPPPKRRYKVGMGAMPPEVMH